MSEETNLDQLEKPVGVEETTPTTSDSGEMDAGEPTEEEKRTLRKGGHVGPSAKRTVRPAHPLSYSHSSRQITLERLPDCRH